MLAVADELAFFTKHQQVLYNGTGLAETALLWSDDTADYYGSHLPEIDFMVDKPQALRELDYQSSFSGGYEALMRSGTSFKLLDETGIATENALAGIKTLLLTDTACMSDAVASRIRDWVRSGGTLIATNNSSLFDENGRQRADFALAEVLGASYVAPRGISQWDVIALEPDARRRYNLPREDIPSPGYQLRVTAHPRAQVLAHYYEPTGSRYSPKPEMSPDPAIIANRFGQGACLYLAGTACRLYWTYRIAEYFELLTAAARQQPLLQIEASSSSIEAILRQVPGGQDQVIHLLNYTGEMERPIKRIQNVGPVTLRVRTDRPPGADPGASQRAAARLRADGQYLVIKLPTLGLHEAILLRYA